jgi:hypothetical protein
VAQVEFVRHILKPGLLFKGEDLKPPVAFGRYGSTEFEVHRGPHRAAVAAAQRLRDLGVLAAVALAEPRVVALQVAFERQTLKPVFSLDRL